MNRQPQDSSDVDPRFNYTAGFRPASNVVPHLDFGTLSMLGNHLVSNASSDLDYNVYMAMLPLTPVDVGPGWVRGTDRIVTTRSGLFGFGSSGRGGGGSEAGSVCACVELFNSGAGFVKRWRVNASGFELQIQPGQIAVATPSCDRC